MEKVSINAMHRFDGPAPIDYSFIVELEVKMEDGTNYFLYAEYPANDGEYYFVNKVSFLYNQNLYDPIEIYDDFDEAVKSFYGEEFKELKNVLDEYVDLVLEAVDDTCNFDNYREGANITSKGFARYGELATDHLENGNKLYFQVKKIGDKNLYSITDKSIFLMLDMGPLYEEYYKNKEFNYLFQGDDLAQLGKYKKYEKEFDKILDNISNNDLEEMV